MAFTFSVNNRPSTGGYAMYMTLANFIAAGWTVKSSSDGTTYNSTGNQITSGASGANGMANNYAWFRIQDPGGVREFVVQRGTINLTWAAKYSVAAKFVTGSPTATQVPTATDEVSLYGNILGNGGSGGTFPSFFATDGEYTLHMGMGDSSIHYAFWMAAVQLATSDSLTVGSWFMDYVQKADSLDLDPTVHLMTNAGGMFGNIATNTEPGVASCYFTSIASANFNNVRLEPWSIAPYGMGAGSGQALGNNGWNNLEDVLPMLWAQTTKGYKGWSTLFQTTMTSTHWFGDTASVGNPPVFGTKNYITGYTGSASTVIWPWPAGVDPIN
jgi:hypothetical protein